MNITYGGLDRDVDISNEPSLLIIKEHLIEHYIDKDLRIYPYMDSKDKKITATFYLNGRCIISTSKFGHAWIGRIRCKRELINKLSLIGFGVI